MYRVLLIIFIFCSCQKEYSPIRPGTYPSRPVALFPDSPFWQPIESDPLIHPQSHKMVKSLISEAQKSFVLSAREWTVPVFYSSLSDQTFDIPLKANWAPVKEISQVKIPEYAEPDPASDGHLTIIDQKKGCVYDFWKAKKTNKDWKAAWANAIPISSDGIYPRGFSARGSGFALLQGLIWPEEIEKEEINHALIFSFNHTRNGGPVWPATESDGTERGDSAIPEGALVQLDPSLDLERLNLNTYERTIARALQKYGMYCADDGGGLQLYAVNANSYSENPYKNYWGTKALVSLKKIPAEHFRVLQFGMQKKTEAHILPNPCNGY